MEVKRYENDELHIVLKNPYCQHNQTNGDYDRNIEYETRQVEPRTVRKINNAPFHR
jgi:hypothetical protein